MDSVFENEIIHFVCDDTPKKTMKEIIADKKKMMDEKNKKLNDEKLLTTAELEKKRNDEIEDQKRKQLQFEKVKQMLAQLEKTKKHYEYKNTKMICECGKEYQRQFKSRHYKTKFHLNFLKGE